MASSLGSSKIVGTGSFLLVYRRVVVHWRAIILLLILAVATVPIAYGDFFDLITLALFLLFIASQVFWIGRILDLGERFIPGKPRRACPKSSRAFASPSFLIFTSVPSLLRIIFVIASRSLTH